MAYRYGNRTQITFLPDSIENYVLEDDPVRVYDSFIKALNPVKLGLDLNENSLGNSSYDPVTMLKVLVYGYSYGWRSSRKIERALHHNLSFIWMAGGLKPDHKTISKFRKDNKEVLKNVLKQCARMCMKLNLIEGNTLFVDGSKFRANAGKSQTKSIEKWKSYSRHVEQRIDTLLEECNRVDENEIESLVEVRKELRSKEKLKSKIAQVLHEIEAEEKVNGTDPDCQIMMGRQGSHASYNGQIVTDEKHGMIVSTDVNSLKNDLNQLSTQIKNADLILEKESETVCADAGYSSVEDLELLVNEGKRVIVPNNKQAQKNPKENPFEKDAFMYDAKKETYTCPAGKEMCYSSQREGADRIEYRMKNKADCLACKHFGVCTKSKTGRRLYRLVKEKTREHLAQLYDSEQGKEIYKKRKMYAEHQFGHIKRNLGAGTFLLRGLDGVNAEFSLLGTSYNIARMITILGGVKPVIELLAKVT